MPWRFGLWSLMFRTRATPDVADTEIPVLEAVKTLLELFDVDQCGRAAFHHPAVIGRLIAPDSERK
jgi:hypothetical protein